jgi:hypothetical protein
MDAVAPHPDKPSVDAVSAFRQPTKSPRSFPWFGTGIRVFILFLIGALIVVVAREWDWWVGSAATMAQGDPCSNREVAGDDPFLCKRTKKPDVSVNKS